MKKKEIIKKIMFNRSGQGKISPRIALPLLWVNDMGFDEFEQKEILMKYDEEKKIIILSKKE